jgi:hypothetical protein
MSEQPLRIPRLSIAVLPAAIAVLAWPGPARGAADESFTYSAETVWSTAVRLLRVDLGHRIVEQDRDNGYLLFVVEQNGREYTGSLEMIAGTGEYDTPVVNVTITVQGLPRTSEDLILRKLKLKLRDQFGAAPRPRRPEPPAPVPAPAPVEEPAAGNDPETP